MAIPGSGHSRAPAEATNEEPTPHDQTQPEKRVKAIADTADVPVDADVAARMANSIGPALEGFAGPVAGTLQLDLEPASFLLAQVMKV